MLHPKDAAGTSLFRNGFVNGRVHLGKFGDGQIADRINIGLGLCAKARRKKNQGYGE